MKQTMDSDEEDIDTDVQYLNLQGGTPEGCWAVGMDKLFCAIIGKAGACWSIELQAGLDCRKVDGPAAALMGGAAMEVDGVEAAG